MRFRPLSPAAAVVAVALAAPVAASSDPAVDTAATKRCVLKGSETVVKNRYGRVFERSFRDGTTRLYSCLYKKNRRVVLDEATGDTSAGEGYDAVKLNGRFVAWQHTTYDDSCRFECTSGSGDITTLWVENIRTHRQKQVQGGLDTERALVVTRTGAIAWVQGGRVWARGTGGERILYDGTDAKPNSLRLRGSTVSWLVGDERMSAVLR
jgi:hypothetical protein